MLRMILPAFVLSVGLATASLAQTPSPFPRPGEQRPSAPPVAKPAPPPQAPAPARPGPSQAPQAPDEQLLGVPVYPGADFLTSYDAGQSQRYYLFGTNTPFTDIVNYYKNVLRQRGELVYDEPPIHQFDVGRFREESMAFPPGVTVKDYTWGGSQGYLNPKRGAEPARFKTIIQIVPEPR